MYMTDEVPTGWVKPGAKPTLESLRACIAELRAELAEAESQLREMEEGARLEALVRVRNLMRVRIDAGRPGVGAGSKAPRPAAQGRGVML